MLRKWDRLPAFMQCDEVKEYYDILAAKKVSLFFKRVFDLVVATIMLIILAIPMIIIAVMIKADSPGPVFYRQERVTTYGKDLVGACAKRCFYYKQHCRTIAGGEECSPPVQSRSSMARLFPGSDY